MDVLADFSVPSGDAQCATGVAAYLLRLASQRPMIQLAFCKQKRETNSGFVETVALSYQDGKIVSQKTVSSDLDFDPSE